MLSFQIEGEIETKIEIKIKIEIEGEVEDKDDSYRRTGWSRMRALSLETELIDEEVFSHFLAGVPANSWTVTRLAMVHATYAKQGAAMTSIV